LEITTYYKSNNIKIMETKNNNTTPTPEHQRERIAEFKNHVDLIKKGAEQMGIYNPKSKAFATFCATYMYAYLSNNPKKIEKDPVYFIATIRGDVVGELERAIQSLENTLK